MSLVGALRPFLALDGLVAIVVFSHDGLLVEALGPGVIEAEQAAAELASVAGAARHAFMALGMGEPVQQVVTLAKHEAMLFRYAEYALALIFQPHGNRALVHQILDAVGPQVQRLLGGRYAAR